MRWKRGKGGIRDVVDIPGAKGRAGGSLADAVAGGIPIPAGVGNLFEDAQNTWRKTFAAAGKAYDPARLVLYSGAVSTGGCGSATSTKATSTRPMAPPRSAASGSTVAIAPPTQEPATPSRPTPVGVASAT